MDGTDTNVIVNDLGKPGGIALDHDFNRLFWVEYETHKLRSSNINGGEVQEILQLSKDSGPWGITLTGGRIYWGNYSNKTLQSCTKSGQDAQILYEAPHGINQLAFVNSGRDRINRKNDCEGQSCSNICVLNSKSFRCLP